MNKLTFSLLIFLTILPFSQCNSIGINYGRIANNLASPTKVVSLLNLHNITQVKIYDSNPNVILSFQHSYINLTISLPNEYLKQAALQPSYALIWVNKNILPYIKTTNIISIAVGNEVFSDPHNTTHYLIQAMQNIHFALQRYKLDHIIKVGSPIALSVLGNSYPSSQGSFRDELVDSVFRPMLEFLRRTKSCLMVNAYPIFAYQGNSDVISLDYALFRENQGVVDSGNGLKYFSLFDAQIDAVFSAMNALGFDDIPIVVTETGWPSKGDPIEIGASIANAAAYNGNLVKRILTGGGTPLRPKADLTVYLFALFNENKKPGPTSERNYGLFYPNEQKVYDIPLTLDSLKADDKPVDVPKTPAPSPTTKVTVSRGDTWCVANKEVGEMKLQGGLDYACGEGSADCEKIQPGANCYDPNTLEAHASYAFNSYYQKSKRVPESCDFEGAAVVVNQPPRFGSCEFPTGY